MKLHHQKNSIQQQISKAEQDAYLKRPNPPTTDAIQRAQFVDKTYVWKTK